ncbi:MAG: hypothetical protein ACYDBP_07615 [Leptospirales bacterium]
MSLSVKERNLLERLLVLTEREARQLERTTARLREAQPDIVWIQNLEKTSPMERCSRPLSPVSPD